MPLSESLRSRPAEIRGQLAHSYLENILLRWSERTVADTLQDRSQIVNEMRHKLIEMDETFIDGYDPGVLLEGLQSLSRLSVGLRQRLLDAIRREYAARFRPEERRDALRRLSSAFLVALDVWRDHATHFGLGAQSAELWGTLRQRAFELREFLSDPVLRSRWLP